jgi:hypothetical protein
MLLLVGINAPTWLLGLALGSNASLVPSAGEHMAAQIPNKFSENPQDFTLLVIPSLLIAREVDKCFLNL